MALQYCPHCFRLSEPSERCGFCGCNLTVTGENPKTALQRLTTIKDQYIAGELLAVETDDKIGEVQKYVAMDIGTKQKILLYEFFPQEYVFRKNQEIHTYAGQREIYLAQLNAFVNNAKQLMAEDTKYMNLCFANATCYLIAKGDIETEAPGEMVTESEDESKIKKAEQDLSIGVKKRAGKHQLTWKQLLPVATVAVVLLAMGGLLFAWPQIGLTSADKTIVQATSGQAISIDATPDEKSTPAATESKALTASPVPTTEPKKTTKPKTTKRPNKKKKTTPVATQRPTATQHPVATLTPETAKPVATQAPSASADKKSNSITDSDVNEIYSLDDDDID